METTTPIHPFKRFAKETLVPPLILGGAYLCLRLGYVGIETIFNSFDEARVEEPHVQVHKIDSSFCAHPVTTIYSLTPRKLFFDVADDKTVDYIGENKRFRGEYTYRPVTEEDKREFAHILDLAQQVQK